MKGHIDVDLDGTLAFYDGWKGSGSIGRPIPAMVEKIKEKRKLGIPIHILTARAAMSNENRDIEIKAIEEYCFRIFGEKFKVTAEKDYGTMEIWDDRARQVIKNKGTFIGD